MFNSMALVTLFGFNAIVAIGGERGALLHTLRPIMLIAIVLFLFTRNHAAIKLGTRNTTQLEIPVRRRLPDSTGERTGSWNQAIDKELMVSNPT